MTGAQAFPLALRFLLIAHFTRFTNEEPLNSEIKTYKQFGTIICKH